ncbi:mediator complex subunit 28 isoform X2 [Megachile rotundata]
MATPTNGNGNLVDEFEEAFQQCLSILITKDEGLGNNGIGVTGGLIVDKEEARSEVEQVTLRFIDLARQMEAFFLQKRFLLSALKPELVVKEDISDLRVELARKEDLIKRHYDKITVWQNLLADLQGWAKSPAQGPAPNGLPNGTQSGQNQQTTNGGGNATIQQQQQMLQHQQQLQQQQQLQHQMQHQMQQQQLHQQQNIWHNIPGAARIWCSSYIGSSRSWSFSWTTRNVHDTRCNWSKSWISCWRCRKQCSSGSTCFFGKDNEQHRNARKAELTRKGEGPRPGSRKRPRKRTRRRRKFTSATTTSRYFGPVIVCCCCRSCSCCGSAPSLSTAAASTVLYMNTFATINFLL